MVLNYCKETLKNNEEEEEFEGKIKEKKEKVIAILKEKDGDFEANYDTFNYLLSKFKRSGKQNYDFLISAGESFQTFVFLFCKRLIKEEKFPASFRETVLHQIFKGGKSRRDILADNRFVHCKTWLPRVTEGLVVEDGLKQALVSESSVYQIGGQLGHRPEELIFVMKSIIGKYRSENKQIIL